MNIDEIKKISLVEFLSQSGYQPTGRDSKGQWFYSPCRSERKPPFHINPRKGVLLDFGNGAGGDIFHADTAHCRYKGKWHKGLRSLRLFIFRKICV